MRTLILLTVLVVLIACTPARLAIKTTTAIATAPVKAIF
jgi:hypothetical protein